MKYKQTFKQKVLTLADKAVNAIDRYKGPKANKLKTGETAVDLDDAYLIIGTGEPVLRNKKDQNLLEKGLARNWDDKTIRSLDFDVIFFLADTILFESYNPTE